MMAGTLSGWRAYALVRGDNAPTEATDAAANAALARASDYILHAYVTRFLSGYDESSPYVEEATYEAANYELATPGFFKAAYTPDQVKVLTEVKGIKWTVRDADTGGEAWQNATPTVSLIEAMLSRYVEGTTRIGITAVGPL